MSFPSRFQISRWGVFALGFFLVAGSLAARQTIREPRVLQSIPGEAVNGLRLSIQGRRTQGAQSAAPKFIVELRNVGKSDLVLNLGTMVSKGGRQYPSAVSLLLVDAAGKSHQLHLKTYSPSSAPGTQPLLLPLPAGSTFSLPVDLRNYWALGEKEFNSELKPGAYSIEAQFNGLVQTNERQLLTEGPLPRERPVSERPFDLIVHPESNVPTSNILHFAVGRP